ncbi:CoA transferase [Planctomycetota bacterium]|nr:CoA transferase [Planctomycetota bacterium]
MGKPFEGMLVADFSHVLSGPYTTMMLADMGARVIKIERPAVGDDSRQFGPFKDGVSMYFQTVNRGKESVALDLKDEGDREVAMNIVRRADVLVENFRPGTMAKLGLGYEDVHELNKRLIYASISGFGQEGSMSKLPAYDALVQAMSGFMSVTGEPDGPPIKAGPSIADMLTGVYAYAAITTALYQRSVTGQGTHIDVSMFDCMVSFLESDVVSNKVLKKNPSRIGNRHPSISPFDTFKCADDYIVICAGTDQLFGKACGVMGLDKLAEDAEMQTNQDRVINFQKLTDAFNGALGCDTAKSWYARFVEAGVPVGLVNDIEEALKLPAVKERNMLLQAGPYTLPGNPMRFSTIKVNEQVGQAPELGEQSESIKQEFSE